MSNYEPPMVVAQAYYPPVTGVAAAPTVLPSYQYTAPPPSQNVFTKRVEHTKVSFVRDRRGPCYWMLNILWILLAGWHFFLAWFMAGIIMCCTIVMIPCGWQVLKISWFLLFPFGQSIESSQRYGQCGGCNCCLNALWMLTAGWILSLQALITGVILCCTVVGIPFGWQCFKLAILCFWPFGLELSTLEVVETMTTVTTYNR